MENYLIEENNEYALDCRNALWAKGDIHDTYSSAGILNILVDADFAIETDSDILLIEYKNACIPKAIMYANQTRPFVPTEKIMIEKVVRKYYDSLHYLRLSGKEKPVRFIYVLEYPKGDPVTRGLLRDRLKKLLPFKLQEQSQTGIKLIESVDVVNINEWNVHDCYGKYPIIPASQITHT